MQTETDSLIRILLQGNQLKSIPRSGWVQRGVPNAEDVAAHSYGVAFTALLLADLLQEAIDLGKLLSMALIHDLPEAVTGDITTPSWRLLPDDTKQNLETKVIEDMLAGSTENADLLALWRELQEGETSEARLVKDADKIEMYLQALVYEETSGNLRLQEFWERQPRFHYSLTENIYRSLRQRRDRSRSGIGDSFNTGSHNSTI